MKFILQLFRIIVGILFIFSGLIKANDPSGLSYKMQEFFEVWNITFLNDFTLVFSILMIAFEIIAGVAVLLGWKFELFSWLLFVLIIFFTFLTGYAVLSGKIRECGCFGDCIKLTADQSFYKDLILFFMIGLLLLKQKNIQPITGNIFSIIILLFTSFGSFFVQWHVLQHLPYIDCLPYKVGVDIQEGMKAPAGSVPDSTVINFVYSKNGQEVEFDTDHFPNDFKAITTLQQQDGRPVIVITSDFDKVNQVLTEAKISVPIYKGDAVAIKTAARSTPTLYRIQQGVILEKWGREDMKSSIKQ